MARVRPVKKSPVPSDLADRNDTSEFTFPAATAQVLVLGFENTVFCAAGVSSSSQFPRQWLRGL